MLVASKKKPRTPVFNFKRFELQLSSECSKNMFKIHGNKKEES
jgi:hypothetical protein